MRSHYTWIVNNFFHDLSSGLWAACLLVIWRLATLRPGMPPAAAAALATVSLELFYVLLGSLVVIFATGGIRLRYWRSQAAPDELTYVRRALLVKHAIYFVVYGAGTLWAWLLLR